MVKQWYRRRWHKCHLIWLKAKMAASASRKRLISYIGSAYQRQSCQRRRRKMAVSSSARRRTVIVAMAAILSAVKKTQRISAKWHQWRSLKSVT
jgi:hypothetical protein